MDRIARRRVGIGPMDLLAAAGLALAACGAAPEVEPIAASFENAVRPAAVARPAAIYGPENNIYDMETAMFLRLQRHLPILLPNGVAWVESCFAIARADAISVPISYDATEPEIAYRLSDANCRAVVTTAERADLVARLKAGAPTLSIVILHREGASPSQYETLATTAPKSAPRENSGPT